MIATHFMRPKTNLRCKIEELHRRMYFFFFKKKKKNAFHFHMIDAFVASAFCHGSRSFF